MTPERWARIEALYHQAHLRPPDDRAEFLARACADDETTRREVEALLRESESDDGWVAGPAPAEAPNALTDLVAGSMVGSSLGAYHLKALLGAGGMGDVYQAHDPKLARDVAIKILSRGFTASPDRLARFDREARMLGALNHPNICGIYGIEEGDGVRCLILELVDGQTLADTITSAARRPGPGGLPLGRALAIARQIADALEAAHDKGIVHRDLKPANIKITPDGVVKVLDFGLAKIVTGNGTSPDLTRAPDPPPGQAGRGAVIGTAAYMSPEQARGLPVDKRTDVWAFGCVLYEMLTGKVAFAGATVSDSIARILEREPDWSALPRDTPAPIRRLLLRCLAKDPKRRLRDIGDAAIEIDGFEEELPAATPAGMVTRPARAIARTAWLPWIALAALAATGAWQARAGRPAAENPLADARFTRVTNWQGTEEQAEISPDGRFVAFLADREGQLDVWVSQVGTGRFNNLTRDLPPLATPGNLLRSLGFSFDGSEIWLNPSGNPGKHKVLMPLTGGTARPFLGDGESAPSWSPDEARLAYIASSTPGDPIFLADRTGADARPVVVPAQRNETFFRKGVHTHNPVWSPDSRWIYFLYGTDPLGSMDIWRMQPSGESPEQLTRQNAPVSFLAPLDSRTLLYVARADDWSGPWLWAVDVDSKVTRRVTAGLEQYTSVSVSRDGRRVVATVASPTASLWRVPLRDRTVDEHDAQPYPVPTERALAPRFGGTTLFYLSLSAGGTGDGLWRVQNGESFEVRKGADGALSEPAVASPGGDRVAVVVRRQGRRQLAIMAADGTNSRTLAPSIDIQGVVGAGTADWSPDGKWIVTGGRDEGGPGLFKIPVDGGQPVRLASGEARGPVWSPRGDLIAYATPFNRAGGSDALRGVRPDGTPAPLPEIGVRLGGAHRFLPRGAGLVYLPGVETKDFWLLDLATGTVRQLTDLADRGYVNGFDITPDGRHLLFDRSRQNSDVVLIDLPDR
jgi:Tol biopolymer transport system component